MSPELRQPLIFLLACVLLSSCARNHYINNMPATPLFEKTGDMNAKIGFGKDHYEFQASISPVPFLGLSRTELHGSGLYNHFNITTTNLHLYSKLGRLPLFVDLSGGMGEGTVMQKKWHLPVAQEYESTIWNSSFQKKELGLFIHYRYEYEMNMQVGIGLFYREVIFNEMSVNYSNYKSGTITQSILPNQSFQSLNPVLVFSIQPKNHPSVGIDFSLSYQVNLSSLAFQGTEVKTGSYAPPIGTITTNATLNTAYTPLLFATTFRLNTNFIHAFGKLKRR